MDVHLITPKNVSSLSEMVPIKKGDVIKGRTAIISTHPSVKAP